MTETLDKIKGEVSTPERSRATKRAKPKCSAIGYFKHSGMPAIRRPARHLNSECGAKGARTQFADLLWRPRLLMEMKSRGERLQKHYPQAFEYWIKLVPDRPRYVVLCNFDEFWIYNFNLQLDEPVDRISLDDFTARYTAFNFLFPDDPKPSSVMTELR